MLTRGAWMAVALTLSEEEEDDCLPAYKEEEQER